MYKILNDKTETMRLKKYKLHSLSLYLPLFSLCVHVFLVFLFLFPSSSPSFSPSISSLNLLNFRVLAILILGLQCYRRTMVFFPLSSTTRSILSSMILANVSNYLTADRRGVNLISDVMWKMTFLLQKFVPN